MREIPCWRDSDLAWGCGEGFGIARHNGAYYGTVMQAISLKLPNDLLAQLSSEAKARGVTKSWLVRGASKGRCASHRRRARSRATTWRATLPVQ